MQKAVEKENFEKAAELKKEIEIRKGIEEAKAIQDFEKAAELKKQLSAKPDKNPKGREFNTSTSKTRSGFYPPEKGKVAVYFVRKDVAPGLVIAFEYFHENQYIGKFYANGYLRYECDPGENLFWASSENKEFITTDLEANQIYIIRVTQTMGGVKAHVAFRPVTQYDKKSLKKVVGYVNKKDVDFIEESELVSRNNELKSFIVDNLNRYEKITKDRYNFKHVPGDYYIPVELLE